MSTLYGEQLWAKVYSEEAFKLRKEGHYLKAAQKLFHCYNLCGLKWVENAFNNTVEATLKNAIAHIEVGNFVEADKCVNGLELIYNNLYVDITKLLVDSKERVDLFIKYIEYLVHKGDVIRAFKFGDNVYAKAHLFLNETLIPI